MGVRSFVKNTVKDNTNLKGWASWHAIRQGASELNAFVKDIKPKKEELSAGEAVKSFEEAVKRFGLTEAQLSRKKYSYLFVALVTFLLGLIGFFWGVYLFFHSDMFLSALVGFSLSALMFACAYYENICYLRIKYRRLNIKTSEWMSYLFSRRRA